MLNQSITVILPCYNSSKFIDETINSILDQSYKNITIIAIDDGSTDNTRAILNKYCKYLAIYTHEQNINKGIAASLNLGLKQAKSDLIAFIDHDDVWYPSKIQRQVEVFNKYPDVDLVYTNGDIINNSGKKLYKIYNTMHSEQNVVGNLLLDCYIKSCSTVMLTQRIVNKVGLFNESLLPTDHDMWLRIQEISKFYYISDSLVGYRVHSEQSTHKRKLWEDGFLILNDACKRYPYGSVLKSKRQAVLYYRLGEHDLKARKYISSASNFLKSFRYDPVRAIKSLIN
jgi:glycosyltransferase involved in cell wall biosynthesis